jgi:DNA-binding CsgD family transcriptional regulator
MIKELTPVQKQIWDLRQQKMTNKQIAETLGLTSVAVSTQVTNCKKKLGIDRRNYHVEELKEHDRDVDDVLDEVDLGLRCAGCHLLFTPRSTCTPQHCDARDDPFGNDLEKIKNLMTASNNAIDRKWNKSV